MGACFWEIRSNFNTLYAGALKAGPRRLGRLLTVSLTRCCTLEPAFVQAKPRWLPDIRAFHDP